MVEIKSLYKMSWAPESSLGNNGNGAFTALTAGDTAYLLGDYSEPLNINVKSEQTPFYLANSHNYDSLTKQQLSVDPQLPFLLMDGIPFKYALGACTDGTDEDVKTHSISTKATSADLPSFTLHYEATDVDGTSNIYKDVLGCRVDELILKAERFKPIHCQLNCIGLEFLDSVHLTNDPALKPTAVDKAFRFPGVTFKWNANTKNQLHAFTLRIKNNLKKTYVDRTTTYYRAKYLDSWEQMITWACVLELQNKTMIDEIKAAAARTFEVTLQRTDADDTITITLSNSIARSAPLQFVPFDRNTYTLAGITKTCTVAVRDAIATY